MKKNSFVILFLFFVAFSSNSQVMSEWRSIGRTGIYNETGLLKKWPDNGPELLWYADSLPNGHSSAAIANGKICLTGIIDSTDYLFALDMKGKLKWKTPIGKAWTISFPESRCTPTIEDNRVYVVSGWGNIVCADLENGKMLWSKSAAIEFGAKLNEWGVSESLIIDGEKIYFSPVGKQTTTIALNKMTGKLIWKTESIGDSLAYVSPILINYAGKKQMVNVSSNYLFGVDTENGKIVWKFNVTGLKKYMESWGPIINCTTPLYAEGKIYVTSGYDDLGIMLKLKDDGSDVKLLWTDSVLDNHHGGVVKIGEFIYGSNWKDNANGNWCCIDWNTGKLKYETKWKCKGSIIAADGMLYCYEERSGNLALVPVNPEKFDVISSFKIPYGRGPYWSHPVIKDGILYVRHGKALMSYKIK
jgi:outer membrane protein assembly factor BamB